MTLCAAGWVAGRHASEGVRVGRSGGPGGGVRVGRRRSLTKLGRELSGWTDPLVAMLCLESKHTDAVTWGCGHPRFSIGWITMPNVVARKRLQ